MNSWFDWPSSLTRFVPKTTVRAEAVNAALDSVSAGLDDLATEFVGAIRLPDDAGTRTITELPGARAGRVLGFDASGNLIVSTFTMTSLAANLASITAATAAASSSALASATHAGYAAGYASAASASATLAQAWAVQMGSPVSGSDYSAKYYAAQAAAAVNGGVASVNGASGVVVLSKADIGLGNADNTSDANKPVSTAQAAALALKAPSANPTFTGTVNGITAAMVGLGSVNNTSDANKPVSTAQQAALDTKAPLILTQNIQSAAYTFVLSDSGKHILHPSADTTARAYTIPANSSVAYPIGTAITVVNQNGAGIITIAITSDTMRLAGVGSTGSRTLAANGICTLLKITATDWLASGNGLT